MYQNKQYYPNDGYHMNQNNKYPTYYTNKDGDRIISGGFLGAFVLGGITGGLVAPYFYRPYPAPYPMPYPPRYW